MASMWRKEFFILVLYCACLYYAVAESEDESDEATNIPPGSKDESGSPKPFLEPKQLEDTIDVFMLNSTEYLIVSHRVPYMYADVMCKMYSAELVEIKDYGVSFFLAEALSETNLLLDSLWIGGRKIKGVWKWKSDNTTVMHAVKKEITKVMDIKNYRKECLAFQHRDHDKPQFMELMCDVDRPFICERPRGSERSNDSTHRGWIEIDDGLYKIFQSQVDYETAKINCLSNSLGATLALVSNMKTAKALARLLLVGRPSLENAWIGYKWSKFDQQYLFEADPEIILRNTSDRTGFPPWRNKTISKVDGCILLDRHLAKDPYFIEARCHRFRGYICYKPKGNSSINGDYKDIKFGNRGYRLYYTAQPWSRAVTICAKEKFKLAEPVNSEMHNELLYVMGETTIDIQHIWLGGKMVSKDKEKPKWIWQTLKEPIKIDLIKNQTFSEEVEFLNVCLNMDRENHLDKLYYGARCNYPQPFVCQYSINSKTKQLIY